MAPPRGSDTANPNTVYALSLLSEYTHALDSLPVDLSRNFADLRELDAVLSSSMTTITAKIYDLIQMIEQNSAPKEERLWLLVEIAEEATRLKLGGEDKIRVACQAADNLKSHANHLRALSERVPEFDTSTLNRRTTYPHVNPRSFMPPTSMETGRRRRGGFGSLLSAMPDANTTKRKRVAREEDVDTTQPRSPKKDRVTEGNGRARNGGRAKKTERAVSPAESMLSVASHVQPHLTQNGAGPSRGSNNQTNSRSNNTPNTTTNKRSRTANNNRAPSPQQSEHHTNGIAMDHSLPNGNGHHHHNGANANGHHNGTNGASNSRRDAFNVPPSSQHPSLPQPFHANGTHNVVNHAHPANFDQIPPSHANTPDWNPPQQLEGPGMPVARTGNSNGSSGSNGSNGHPIPPGVSGSTGTDGGATEGGDNEADGDDRTYCFCDGVSYGEMIACDDHACEREWFHLACIGLDAPPAGQWFCETCRSKRNKRSGRGGKRRTTNGRSNGRGA
ncbi:hypothetical protein BDN72DRAFT_870297 [Pluteus cervinus]|uniref:Uncharacterized protein n=1 Tax=Pluteus cervinus TaxID=181527 RepID=A0ACD3AYI6_9AGAR|nr:hypothetical protein BDN72DRAFT_870297 [Pluteus cervinus]